MSRTKPCVLLCGYTGVGKTSVAQYYCGKDVVPDSAIGDGRATTSEFTYYKSKHLDIWDYRGFETGLSIDKYIEELKKFAKQCYVNNGLTKCPQIVLYCIQGPGARVTKADLDVINTIPLPTIVLVTKNDITRPNQRKAMKTRLLTAGISRSDIRYCSSIKSTGFKSIEARVQKLQPEAEQRLEELKKECYIATQVFESGSCLYVLALRELRDRLLVPNSFGRRIVYSYYKHAPDIADYIPDNQMLRKILKVLLSLLAKSYTWIFGG